MFQLEAKLRIIHERASGMRRWRREKRVVQAARGESGRRKEREWGDRRRATHLVFSSEDRI